MGSLAEVALGLSCSTACGILVLWQGIEPASSTLQGRFQGDQESPPTLFFFFNFSFGFWLNNCLSFYLLDFLYTCYSLFSRASARNVSLLSIYSNTTANLVISITSGNIPPEILCLSLLQSGPLILLSRDLPSFSSVGFLFLYNLTLSISLEQSILLFAFPFLVRGGCVRAKLLQPCLTAYDPMEPARLLWPWDSPGMNTAVVAKPSSRGSSQPRDRTLISCVSCILYQWATREIRQWT